MPPAKTASINRPAPLRQSAAKAGYAGGVQRLARALLAWLGALILRGLGATWRIARDGADPFAPGAPRPVIFAAWHRDIWMALYLLRGRKLAISVSLSRDGDRVAALLRRMGFAESPRGSSSRGAAALLREMLRTLRRGRDAGILPDGPLGPAGVAQPGAVALARISGAPLVPVAMAATPCWRFASWDRGILPKPFARVRLRFGEALRVPPNCSPAELEAARRRLESRLHQLCGELCAELRGELRGSAQR